MTVDREYCMNSFLTYRTIQDGEYAFADWLPARRFSLPPLEKRLPVRDSETLENELRRATQEACKDGKAALMVRRQTVEELTQYDSVPEWLDKE